MTGRVYLREVEEGDLPDLFVHQRDPVANQMAAFPAREREAFMVHWRKILTDDGVIKRTIVHETEVAGNVLCFEQSGRLLIGYWLGRRFWGQGIASRAVSDFVSLISARPLHAYVAKDNVASIRVLEKCGFKVSGESAAAVTTGDEIVDEFIYSLSK
jgi:RimJ/RimL family protein N-acetyltransferase